MGVFLRDGIHDGGAELQKAASPAGQGSPANRRRHSEGIAGDALLDEEDGHGAGRRGLRPLALQRRLGRRPRAGRAIASEQSYDRRRLGLLNAA